MELIHMESTAGQVQCGLFLSSNSPQRAFILLPGFWGDFRRPAYQTGCETLSRHGTVLAANLRGHGGSEGVFTFGKRELSAPKPLYAFLRETGAKTVTAAGFSMGGWIIASYLAEAGGDALMTEHLVLCGTPSRLPWLFPRPWKPGFALQLLKGGRGVVRVNPLHLWPPRRLDPALARLSNIPTTVVHATGDWMVHHRHGERIFKALEGARRFVKIRDRRGLHVEMLCLYHPETVVHAILNIPSAKREATGD
ncbi:MAG: alpha/beta fold hydrolase [Acidobacteriota bacterium]